MSHEVFFLGLENQKLMRMKPFVWALKARSENEILFFGLENQTAGDDCAWGHHPLEPKVGVKSFLLALKTRSWWG